MLTTQELAHQEFPEAFFKWKVEEEKTKVAEHQIQTEIDFLEDPTTHERAYSGRLSPFVKENLYREYHKGMTIKDLSLKYGIL